MAESALQKLTRQLECAICLQTYSEPKLLQCSHAYCQGCLEGLVDKGSYRQPSLMCPNCRQVTPVPTGGMAELPSAFHVNNLLEVHDSLKLIAQPSTESDSSLSKAPLKAGSCCLEHPGEALRLFCDTCSVLICLKCAIKSGHHRNHSYEELNDAFLKYKGEVVSLLGPLEGHCANISETMDSLKAVSSEIAKQQVLIEADIHDSVNRLHEAIDLRRTELLSELQRVSQDKLQSLAFQQDQLEMSQAQLSSCVQFMRDSLQQTDGGEVLVMKSSIMNQIREVTSKFKPNMLKVATDADVAFSSTPEATEALQKFGTIVASETSSTVNEVRRDGDEEAAAVLELKEERSRDISAPDPTKCYISGENVEIAGLGEESVTVLHVINNDLQLPREPAESIECELVSEIAGSTVQGEVQMIALSQYEIRYRPVVKGRHLMHVKVNGEHIDRSPFLVSVKAPVSDLGTLVQKIGGLKSPWGVAVTDKGEIVASSHDEHCVYVFGPSGEKFRSFGTFGSRVAEFNCPRDVVIDGKGAILITDYKNHRIQQFSIDGKFIQAIGSKGSGPLQFKGPKGVALNTFNNMVYVVDENHRVQIITSDLAHYGSFGKLGSGKGQFLDPWGVACDSMGKVYVTDSTNNRVQIFAADGMFLATIGGHGKAPGMFIFPAGITIDSDDNLYVSERYNHRVSVFNVDGDFVILFGGFGRGPEEMKYPRGLAVDNSGVVYVCDNNNHRISMF